MSYYNRPAETESYCCGCRTNKPLDQFHSDSSRKGNLGKKVQSRCKDCEAKRAAKRAKETYEANRQFIQDAKKKGCMDCGNQYPPWVMDWDHRPETTKLFALSQVTGRHSRAQVIAELAKCDLVCANCHRMRTYRRLQVVDPEP